MLHTESLRNVSCCHRDRRVQRIGSARTTGNPDVLAERDDRWTPSSNSHDEVQHAPLGVHRAQAEERAEQAALEATSLREMKGLLR
jgi:hypothetical protein